MIKKRYISTVGKNALTVLVSVALTNSRSWATSVYVVIELFRCLLSDLFWLFILFRPSLCAINATLKYRYAICDKAQTFVDNLAVEYLLRMHNLQYLNIDGLNITGSLFSELCKLHYTVNRKYWGLRYLSIEEKDFINNSESPAEGLSVENMQIIGKYLPNLTYIDVGSFFII